MSEKYPICPLCLRECESYFRSCEGEIVGCENCVCKEDSWQWQADHDPDGDYEHLMRMATA